MQKLISYFFSDFNFKFQSAWFKRLLYLLLGIKCIYWLCFYDVLFGINSIFLAKPYPISHFNDFAFFLYALASPLASLFFIVPLLLLSLIQLATTRIYFIGDAIIWFLVVNLHNKIYSSLTAGDYLLNQFLMFNCLLSFRYQLNDGWKNPLKVVLHNFAVVAIITQVCVLYGLSGFIKLCNHEWISGEALGLIAQVKHFSLFAFPARAHIPGGLLAGVNYAVLFYQCSFPVLIWFKAVKKPMIVLGFLMHLYIGFVMGLVGFSSVMIISYVFFWPFNKAARSNFDSTAP